MSNYSVTYSNILYHITRDSHYLITGRNYSHFFTMNRADKKWDRDKMLIFLSLINIQQQYTFIISFQLSRSPYSISRQTNEVCIINWFIKSHWYYKDRYSNKLQWISLNLTRLNMFQCINQDTIELLWIEIG